MDEFPDDAEDDGEGSLGDLADDMDGHLLAAERRNPYATSRSEHDAHRYYREAKEIGREMVREGLDTNSVESILARERDLLEDFDYTQTIPVENMEGSSNTYFQPARFSVQD